MQIFWMVELVIQNLALLKIAGFLHDNNVEFSLIEDSGIEDSDADISDFDLVYISKVFSFTKDPEFVVDALTKGGHDKSRFGGTGQI
jgi:hypothetical protein